MRVPRIVDQLEGGVAAARLLAGGDCKASGAIVLAYHNITTTASTDYQVPSALFRKQLCWALAAGLRFVPLSDMVAALLDGQSVDGCGAVVFDDALVGVYRQALPILSELAIPATVFVVADRLGRPADWWPGAEPVMTEEQLGELVDAGLDVASHSSTHPSLPGLSAQRLRSEIIGSRDRLADLLQRPMDLFAYPFGDYDSEVCDVVDAAGYRAAFTFLNGRIVPGLDRLRLPRLNMWAGQNHGRLAYHLARSVTSWGDTQPDRPDEQAKSGLPRETGYEDP